MLSRSRVANLRLDNELSLAPHNVEIAAIESQDAPSVALRASDHTRIDGAEWEVAITRSELSDSGKVIFPAVETQRSVRKVGKKCVECRQTKPLLDQERHLCQRPSRHEIWSAIHVEDASHTFVIGILAVRQRERRRAATYALITSGVDGLTNLAGFEVAAEDLATSEIILGSRVHDRRELVADARDLDDGFPRGFLASAIVEVRVRLRDDRA